MSQSYELEDGSNQLIAYTKALEHQINNKKYFIKETQAAITKLKSQINDKNLDGFNDTNWNKILKNPLFWPERSDPIGLSLASTTFVSRRDTSEAAIANLKSSVETLDSIISNQKEANEDLTHMIKLLKKKTDRSSLSNLDNTATTLQKNLELKKSLKLFIDNYLAADLTSFENSDIETTRKFLHKLIERLIKYDETLIADDFGPYCKGLYRILLKSRIVTTEIKLNGNTYVKLLDFSSIDL